MYGRVDRGGAREGKKSLRKNKVLIHYVKTKPELFQQESAVDDRVSLPAPAIAAIDVSSKPCRVIDILCNLGSRKLGDERERIVARARQEGVEAILVYTPDGDRQDSLPELASQFSSGQLYCVVGVHPDNTRKLTDSRAIDQRVASLRLLALRAETVAIFGGLDLSREVAAHYPQEKLLSSLAGLASSVQLPLMLTCTGGSALVDRLVVLLGQTAVSRVALVHFDGAAADYARLGNELAVASASAEQDEESADDATERASPDSVSLYYVVTGTVCDSSELGDAERERVLAVPLERLLLASDSPNFTPHNISDPWIRERRNEPANLPFVLSALAALRQMDQRDLAAQLRENTLAFFGLPEADSVIQEEHAPSPAKDVAPASAEPPVEPRKPRVAGVVGKGAVVDPAERRPVEKPKRGNAAAAPEQPSAAAAPVQPPDASAAVQYACKKCRHIVFRAADVVPHHRLDGGVALSGADCQVLFAELGESLRDFDGGDAEADEDGERPAAGGRRLACPKCRSNLGRANASEPIACSCGASKPPPASAFARKKLDLVLPIEDARAAMVALKLDEERRRAELEAQDDSDSDDGASRKKKKGRRKMKKTNTANFSSFRNKSYGVKAPSSASKRETAEEKAASGDESGSDA